MSDLTTQQRKFLLSNVLVAFGTAVSGTFFNLFLFKLMNNDLYYMAILQLCKFTSLVVGCIIATHISRRVKIPKINGLGLLFTIITIGFALLGSGIADHSLIVFIVIVGTLWGMGDGFYWLTANLLQQIMVTKERRATFMGLNSSCTNIAFILAPICATFLITALGDMGYIALFIIVIINYLVAFTITSSLKTDNTEQNYDKLGKYPNWLMIGQHKSMKSDFFLCTLQGHREGVILGFISILYIQIFQNNDTFFGVFNTGNAVLVVIASFMFSKLFRNQIKPSYILYVMIPLMFGGIFFGVNQNLVGAICFAVVFNTLNPGYNIIASMRSFTVIENASQNVEECFIGLSFREMSLNLGRGISMVVIISLLHIFGDSIIHCWLIVSHIIYSVLIYKYYHIYKNQI